MQPTEPNQPLQATPSLALPFSLLSGPARLSWTLSNVLVATKPMNTGFLASERRSFWISVQETDMQIFRKSRKTGRFPSFPDPTMDKVQLSFDVRSNAP